MSNFTKYLHIDSKNRISGDSHNYSIQLSPAIFSVQAVKLVALNLPITNNNVNSTNNMIYFTDGITNFSATITPGIYDIFNFMTAIKEAMEATSYAGIVTASWSDIDYKITITGTIPFSLQFSSFTTNSAAYILGYDVVNTSFALSQTANNSFDLSIPPTIFIRVSEFPVMTRSNDSVYGTWAIYLTGNSSDISFHFDNTHFSLTSKATISSLNQLNISLIDPRTGNLFDLNGADWVFLLELIY